MVRAWMIIWLELWYYIWVARGTDEIKKGKHVLRRCNELSNYRLKMKSKERKVLDDYLPRPTKQIQFCILDFAWMNYRIRMILLHEHFRTGALWKKQKQIESVKIRPKTSWNMDIPSITQTQSFYGSGKIGFATARSSAAIAPAVECSHSDKEFSESKELKLL